MCADCFTTHKESPFTESTFGAKTIYMVWWEKMINGSKTSSFWCGNDLEFGVQFNIPTKNGAKKAWRYNTKNGAKMHDVITQK